MRRVLSCIVVSTFISLVPTTSARARYQTPGQLPAEMIGQQPQQQQQQQPLQLKPHLLVQHLPDAQNCPVPDWIVPGMRLTYFTSVAQVNDAQGSVGMVEDPNGNIVDSNGKRYRHGSAVVGGIGGSGWDCMDVIAVEPGVVVIEMKQYFNTNGLQGPVTASGSMPVLCHPSGCDFYMHPRLLAQLQQQTGNGVSLIKGTMEHRGATYNIALSVVESSGTRLSSVYDLSSGVQISHNSSSEMDRGVTYKQDGDNYTPQRNTGRSLANNQFHGARNLNLPWARQQMPAWARTMKTARYQGGMVDSGTPDMGLGRISSNITIDFTTAYVGQTFTAYSVKRSEAIEGMPAMEPLTAMSAVGVASTGGLWMDPAALANLQTGQVIDSDANTGERVMVEFAGQGQDGRRIVVLVSGNQLYKIANTYDAAEGKLLLFVKTERSQSTGGTITTQLQLVGMQ